MLTYPHLWAVWTRGDAFDVARHGLTGNFLGQLRLGLWLASVALVDVWFCAARGATPAAGAATTGTGWYPIPPRSG